MDGCDAARRRETGGLQLELLDALASVRRLDPDRDAPVGLSCQAARRLSVLPDLDPFGVREIDRGEHLSAHHGEMPVRPGQDDRNGGQPVELRTRREVGPIPT
jgi:hypothetical protein